MVDFEQSSLPPKVKSAVEQCSSSASDIGSQLLHGKGHGSSSGIKSSHSSVPHDVSQGSVGKFGGIPHPSNSSSAFLFLF